MMPGRKVPVGRTARIQGLILLCSVLAPAASAAAPETVVPGGDITNNQTWSLSGSPYRITGDVTIRDGKTVTIEPGVEVRFDGAYSILVGSPSLQQLGALWAVGTDTQPIIFRRNLSTRWRKLHFTSFTDDAGSRLEHCRLEYGGETGVDGKNASIYCESASPSFANVIIHMSKSDAIYLNESSPTFYGVIHQTGGTTTGGGGGLGGFSSSSFGGPGQFGVTEWLIQANDEDSKPSFVEPDLLSKGKFIRLGPDGWANVFNAAPIIAGPNYIGEVLGGTLTIGSSWGHPNLTALHLLGTLTISGDANSIVWPVLTVNAGSVLKLWAGTAIEVGATTGTFQGGLVVAGTPASPVLIEGESGAAWKHLRYGSNALAGQCRLEHATMRGASGAAVGSGNPLVAASLVIEGGAPTLKDVRVEDSAASGVYVNNSAPAISNLTVDGFGATGTGLYCRNSGSPASVAVQMTGTNVIDGGGLGQAGVRLSGSEPHLDGLSIGGVTGMAIDGALGSAVAPTFENVTVEADVGALGRGSPDLWANFFNSSPALLGSNWTQEVTSGTLTITTTWGGFAAIEDIHLANDLTISGTASPMLAIAAGTVMRIDSPRSILVGSPSPGGLQILGTDIAPVILEPSGAGRWGRIRFAAASRPDSSIAFCELRSCGGTNDPAALDVTGVSVAFSDLVFTDCGRGAIALTNSSSSMSNIEVYEFDKANSPSAIRPAVSISGGEGVTMTGANVIRGGAGAGRRGFSISSNATALHGPTLSGLDIDDIAERAFSTLVDEVAPRFAGITLGANVGDVAIGGPEFWAALHNSNPVIQGTGYVQAVYGGTLQRSTTWGSGSGQTFSEIRLLGILTINGPTAELTLTPGSTVKIASAASILVDTAIAPATGALVAVGTPAQHIVFDCITPGQRWRTVSLSNQSAAAGSRVEYCEFYNGGGSGIPATLAVSSLTESLPPMRNLTFVQDSGTAIKVTGSGADGWIDSVNIYGSQTGIEVDQTGSSLVITNCTFDSIAEAGVRISGTAASSLNLVEACTFTDTKQALLHPTGVAALVFHQGYVSNWGAAGQGWPALQFAAGSFPAVLDSEFIGDDVVARVPASAVDGLCHSIPPNTFTLGANARVELWGDTIESPSTWTNAVGVPFRVLGNVTFAAPLTIGEGVHVEFSQASTSISMATSSGNPPLRVLGTSAAPVILSPVGASWGGLVGGPGTLIEHAVIDRAGLASTQALELRGAGTVRNSAVLDSPGVGLLQVGLVDTVPMTSPTWLVGSTFSGNLKGGVRLVSSARLEARACTFENNENGGAVASAGTVSNPASSSLRECAFAGNEAVIQGDLTPDAIVFGDSATLDVVDARYCWWDDADGAAGGTQTISQVTQAKYDPWYADALGSFMIADADVDPTTFDKAISQASWSADLTAVGTWVLAIEDASANAVNSFNGSGAVDVDWDGTDSGTGLKAADGTYTFILTADETGGAMGQSVLKGTVTLESSALIAEIHSPAELVFVAGGSSLTITGTVAGTELDSFVLEYGFGNNPKTFIEVATGDDTPIVAGTLGTLQAVPDAVEQGILTLRLRVLDDQLQEVTSVRPLKLHTIVASAATPDPFSPDDDGFQDLSFLSASMAWPSTWTVDVVQGANLIRSLPSGSGTQVMLAWDGKDGSNSQVSDGSYTFEIEATAPDLSTVATAIVPIEVDTSGKAIVIIAPTGAQALHDVVGVTLDINTPSAVDYFWRVEHGPLPIWSLIASGTYPAVPPNMITWDTTQAPSGSRTLRASLILADGTTHSDEVVVTVANPDVTLTQRVIDPLLGESTTIGLNHGGVSLDGTVEFRVKEADVTTNLVWVGKLSSIGATVWTSAPQAMTSGAASVLWDGQVAPGVPASARDYVVEALVTYTGGGSATYSEDPSVVYEEAAGLLSDVSVGTSFNPYYGERVPISFSLADPAWVSLTYAGGQVLFNEVNEAHGMLKSVLHDGGPAHPGHEFLWDGRAVNRDGLGMGDGPALIQNNFIKLVAVPRSLMTVTNKRELIDSPEISPVVIQPVHGQVAVLTYTLPYDARVSIQLIDTVDSSLTNSVGTEFRTLQSETLQAAGTYEVTIDGTDGDGEVPASSGTFAVVIEAKDELYPSFTATRRLCLRILE